MNRTRLWKLEKRKGRPLETLAELADAAPDVPVDLQPRLLGVAGLALGRVGLPDAGAEAIRRALELANAAGNHRRGRLLLSYLDTLDDIRPPWRLPKPPRAEILAARFASGAVRQALELPLVPATTRAELEDLDGLRYEHPEAALCRLLPAADRLQPELTVFWLAVTGSAYRLRAGQRKEIEADLRRAEEHIQAALWAAQAAGDVAGQADALQRLGYVLADRGEHRQALELTERASGIYDRIGDRAGCGKALVDQGMMLHYLGKPHLAIEAQRQALELLPNSAERSRFATYQHLGSSAAALDDLDAADRYAAQAAELLHAVEPGSAARLLWLRAAIAARRGSLDASELYRQALEILRTVHYADAALVTVELVRVLILQGRSDEAHETALAVRQLVIPLQRNRHVSAALAELLRGGREALTLARVERIRAALERARMRPDWRTFKVLSDHP